MVQSSKASETKARLSDNMRRSTHMARKRVEHILDTADKIRQDPDKIKRLKAGKCISCHYAGNQIAGAALTESQCLGCGKPESYPSTLTDKLCLDCTQQYGLCKHCGGAINMSEARSL